MAADDEAEVYTYPPKVVTEAELKAFLPWAAIEYADDGELIIYTGLRHTDDEGDDPADNPLAYIDGMEN